MVTNARTPGARCYGYVTMATSEDASKCIQHLHRTELHGRMISVERVSVVVGASLGLDARGVLLRGMVRCVAAAARTFDAKLNESLPSQRRHWTMNDVRSLGWRMHTRFGTGS